MKSKNGTVADFSFICSPIFFHLPYNSTYFRKISEIKNTNSIIIEIII